MALIPSELLTKLEQRHCRWLVTGGAGFIGSNIIEALLAADQSVVCLDNLSTGHRENVEEVQAAAGSAGSKLEFIIGDIRDRNTCKDVMRGVDIVLHQAALGSVPRSIEDPLTTHDVNVTGFLNILDAARLAGVRRFVYAASSSVYGDEPTLPKQEDRIGNPLSPYAASKLANEIYASIYARTYGFSSTGLRYFNVFGPRQDPEGPYAAVIPKWVASMIEDEQVTIHGDGETSRDFCYVANAVQANLRAALAPDRVQGEIYNVAVGESTSLSELFTLLRDGLGKHQHHYRRAPVFADFRAGDVRHSQADISKARRMLAYEPQYTVAKGIREALPWYLQSLQASPVGNRKAI